MPSNAGRNSGFRQSPVQMGNPAGYRRTEPRQVVRYHPLPDCPRVGHRRARMVRGRYPEPESNHGVGNGGQGRNRTNDTRIFSSSERPVRCEKAEDREGVFDGPTEPPRPTEPIPNPADGRRPSRGVSSRSATASVHHDRAGTEPCVSAARGVGSQAWDQETWGPPAAPELTGFEIEPASLVRVGDASTRRESLLAISHPRSPSAARCRNPGARPRRLLSGR